MSFLRKVKRNKKRKEIQKMIEQGYLIKTRNGLKRGPLWQDSVMQVEIKTTLWQEKQDDKSGG